MSNIFKAISKSSGDLSDAILSTFSEEERSAGEAIASVPVEAAREAAPIDVPPAILPDGFAGARVLPVRLWEESPLLPFDDTDFGAAEQYRIIRTKLIQHPAQPRFLLITSAGPGDGKTVTAANIAGALALKLEAKVILMDLDLRRSALHTRLGLPLSPGLGEVLGGTALEQAVVRIEQFPNLYFLPAGEPGINPSELLDSERWTGLCRRLREEFRYIVADTPPIGSVADYDLLQASCDGVVMVVRPDHTQRDACLRRLRLIPREKFTGVVMNCVSDWFLTRKTQYSSYGAQYDRKGPAGKSTTAARR